MQNLTIVFDLDGTLIDSAPDILAAADHALRVHGLEPDPAMLDELKYCVGTGARVLLETALERMGECRSQGEVDALLNDLLERYARHIADETTVYPAADLVLARLKEIGFRIAVCTNKKQAMARAVMQKLGLMQHVHAVAGRDTLPVHKPDPGHLIGAVILADGNPNRSIMVGDTATDVQTAKRAGIPVIVVDFGYSATPVHELGADQVIAGYGELEQAVQRVMHLL